MLQEGELIEDLLLPTPPRTWRRQAGGQLKTWPTWKISPGLGENVTFNRRAWSAFVPVVVNLIGDTG